MALSTMANPQTRFPPDMTVPLIDEATADRQQQDLDRLWAKGDAAGFADAAYARGLLRFQRGDWLGARAYVDRADQRGSAEAAYLAGLLHLQGGDQEAAMEAFRRADGRGSLWAPLMLANLAHQASDETTAHHEMDAALHRARAADKAGSADGACVTAAVTAELGAAEESIAAARRADRRGSGYGSFFLAGLDYRGGDLSGASRAAKRAAQRGFPAEGLLLSIGQSLQQRGKYHRARRAWTLAASAALHQHDETTYEAAVTRLHPGIRYWLRTHIPGITVFLALSAVLAVLGQWRWLAATAVLALMPITAWITPHPGMLIPTDNDPPDLRGLGTVSVGVVTLGAGMVPDAVPEEPPPQTRPATNRDFYFLPLAPVLLFVLAALLAVWAAGGFNGSAMLRAFYGWAALSLVWYTAWRIPDILSRTPPSEGTSEWKSGIKMVVQVSLTRFQQFHVSATIAEPRIMDVYELIRAHSVEDGPLTLLLARARPLLKLLSLAGFAAFLAVQAFIPGLNDLSAALWVVVSTAIAMAVLGVNAVVALMRAVRGLFCRAWGTLFTGAGSLLAIAGVVAVTYWIGLLGAWADVWDSLLSSH